MKNFFWLIAIMLSLPVSAGSAYHTGKVVRVLLQEGSYGNCMASLLPDISSTGLDCPANWVTFSCSGDYNSKSMGNQKLQAAQLSLVTGNTVRLKVNDSKLINGRCFAERIDVVSQ